MLAVLNKQLYGEAGHCIVLLGAPLVACSATGLQLSPIPTSSWKQSLA